MPNIEFLNKGRDSAKVSEYSKQVLLDLMKKSGISRIVITSTARTAHEQARIMYENIDRHGVDHQKKLYGRFGDLVIDEYSNLKSSGKTRAEIINGMSRKISHIGPRKVSRHAGNPNKLNVIDIAPSSINVAQRMKFENAIKSDNRISKLIIPPTDPAYHIEIPQPQASKR